MVWIVPNERFTLGQSGGKRRAIKAAATGEAEPGLVEGLDLGPLLQVAASWSLERTSHLVRRTAAVWADGLMLRARHDFEALAAGKACVRDQVRACAVTHRFWGGRETVACIASESHAPEFLLCFHTGPDVEVSSLRGF